MKRPEFSAKSLHMSSGHRHKNLMSESWTTEQQQALNEALITYPATMDRRERWKYYHSQGYQID